MSSLLGPNILLITLFLNTVSLHSSLNVSNQVSHPYRTTDKITVLCIFIFTFLDNNCNTKDSVTNDSQHSLSSVLKGVSFRLVHAGFEPKKKITRNLVPVILAACTTCDDGTDRVLRNFDT